ncbi:MAG TPA: hypothetical protein VKU37_01960 [Verrucomicrobiae bacterium]|nr:hypothetical protein [Verrucomicrobiae bacterium]
MKLKIQFGSETCFGQPIPGIIQTQAQGLPVIRISPGALAMAGRPEPIKPELTCGIFLEDASP